MYTAPPSADVVARRYYLDLEVSSFVFSAASAWLYTHLSKGVTLYPMAALFTEWMCSAMILVSAWELLKLLLGKNPHAYLTSQRQIQKTEALLQSSDYGRLYLQNLAQLGRGYLFGELRLARYWVKQERGRRLKLTLAIRIIVWNFADRSLRNVP